MATEGCKGLCGVQVLSPLTRQYVNVGRRSLHCGYGPESSRVKVDHGPHDWYSARSGEFVHCAGGPS